MFKNLKNYYLPVLLLPLISFNAVAQDAQKNETVVESVSEIEEENAAVSEENVEAQPPQQKQIEAGPKLRELEEYTAALLNGLEPYQAQYIYNIRQQYGVIRSVQVVKTDVEKAVQSCGEENPSLKEDITARFEAWNDSIVPKLSVADVALKDAIQRQSFRPTVRVSMLLDHVQNAFEERDAQFEKIPVTTEEACTNLMNSMDNTEESLTALLDATISDLNNMSIDAEQSAEVQENMSMPASE